MKLDKRRSKELQRKGEGVWNQIKGGVKNYREKEKEYEIR